MPSLNPKCRKCGLWETAGTVCVAGDGPKDADIIAIGEAPGATEAKTGRPFMGESGQVLRAELAKNHLQSVYITNIVKCRPPKNRTPTPDEVKACRPYLDQELEMVKPKFVLTLGVPATKVMFRGKAKINEVHGEVIEGPNYLGMPTFHPAYTLRDPSKLPGFQNDLQRLARLVRGKTRKASVNWNVVRRGNLSKFIEEFIEADEFAFDLETSGLFPFNGKGYITAVGIALPNRTWVIPGYMPHSPFSRGQSLKLLMQLLFYLAWGKKAYAQNGKFDNHWLTCYCGGKFHLVFDTMLASHTLNENVAHDLKSMTRTFLDEPEYDITVKEKKGEVRRPTDLYQYCAKDATYTLRLKHVFHDQFKKDRIQRRLFYNLVMPAARAMEEIEMEGLTIDREKMEEVGLELLQERTKAERRLNRLAGKKINWNSTQQVAKVLFDDFALPVTLKTKKGKPSTSEEAVLDLMGEHEIVDLLIKYRELTKFLSTYIRGFKKFMVGDKLYVSYKLHGTVTGRYSSRIHSIPRDGSIRNLVGAPRGWKFVQGDLSQAELRIAAAMSGDFELRECFTYGIDVHWRTLMETLRAGGVGEYVDHVYETAETYKGWRPDNFSEAADILLEAGPDLAEDIWGGWKEGRKKAKAINFGFIYGMYENKFIKTAKIKYGWEPTMREAKNVRETYFNLYSGISSWHSKQKKLARLNGYVRCLTGRLRRLPGINSRDRTVRSESERQAINSPVQGTIGDYKAMVMVEVHETIDREKLRVVGEHHDAVLMIVRDGCEDEVLPQVLKIIRQPRLLETLKVRLDIPMEGELEVGPWGAGKEYKEAISI